jgi:hypothetical protein
MPRLLSPDTVEEVWFKVIAGGAESIAATPVSAASPQVAAIGAGTGRRWQPNGRERRAASLRIM